MSRQNTLSAVLAGLAVLLASVPAPGKWKVAAVTGLIIIAVLDRILAKREEAESAAAEEDRRKIKVEPAFDPPRVTLPVDVSSRIDAWVTSERDSCLTSLHRERPSVRSLRASSLGSASAGAMGIDLDALEAQAGGNSLADRLTLADVERLEAREEAGETLTEEQAQALHDVREQLKTALQGFGAGVTAGFGSALANATTRPDPRSAQEYKAEVEEYLRRGAQVLRRAVKHAEVHSGRGLVTVWLKNLTDRAFEGVVLEVYIPGQVAAGRPDNVHPAPALPSRPRSFGHRLPLSDFGSLAIGYRPHHPMTPGLPNVGPAIDNSASAKIEFPPVVLRPKATIPLDAIHFVTDLPAGNVLRGEWSATAVNADGRATGTFELVVEESPDTVETVFAALAKAQAGTSDD